MSWVSVSLGDIAEFINGIAFKPENWGDQGSKIIRIQNLTDPTRPFNRTMRKVDPKFIVHPGELLVSWSATLGVFEWHDAESACVNQHIFRVVPKANRVEKNYLRHVIEMALVEMERHLHGATMQHVNRAEFLGTRIPLPPLPEQRRIAAILDQAEALRAKRRTALAKLDTLAQSIFIEMFGDPATNLKGFPITEVGDLADVQGGLQVTTARKDHPIEVPYLRVANVYRSSLDLSVIKLIRATEAEIARTALKKGDLLIVEGHGNAEEIGRSALWDGSVELCIHQNHIIRARFDQRKIDSIFACAYLNSPAGRRHLLRAGKTTSGLNTISVSEVRGTPIAMPPLPLQKTFANRLRVFGRLKETHESSLAHLDSLFATLQHRAFRGEL